MAQQRVSAKVQTFTESVIREMTRLVGARHGEAGINLAQGFPDFAAPQAIKDAACAAIQSDVNQYAITWGAKEFRNAIAEKTQRFLGLEIDPEREITVCCGATEAMLSALLATLDPGDEVVIFSPFYENYGPDCVLSGAQPRFVTLHPPDWNFDRDELAAVFNERTRGVIINTPHNPTGKVFSREELQFIADLCLRYDALAYTDEIYEHLTYDGAEHVSMATLPGMRERTVVVNGLSKTYSVTGWRVGYTIAPPDITDGIRKVHDFVTVGAPAPLQEAGAVALRLPEEYYASLQQEYLVRRDLMLEGLRGTGFRAYVPQGAYYVMAEIDELGLGTDVELARHLIEEHALAVVPGSSFYADPDLGRTQVRFCFAKRRDTLERAIEALSKVGVSV
ncbi:MAG: aminotransferase class I/II-fold pyridoxal phosphate-dependent enzyme [Chloroflexota bacterium]|nr:aminotransferase class I/II-fold pyridoxal phosphate-dependent enzyme [Chloroflexota bacterium]